MLISTLKKQLTLQTKELFHEKYALVSRKVDTYKPNIKQRSVKDIVYIQIKDGYIVTSLRFNPKMGGDKGITSDQLVKSVMDGVRQAIEKAKRKGIDKADIDCEIIATLPKFFDRDYGISLANDVVRMKKEGLPISGFDFAGPEVEFIDNTKSPFNQSISFPNFPKHGSMFRQCVGASDDGQADRGQAGHRAWVFTQAGAIGEGRSGGFAAAGDRERS